jgi:hypothetical protein
MFLASYSHAVAIFGFDFSSSRTWYPLSTLVMGELCAILMELEKKCQKGGACLLAPLTPAASSIRQGADFDSSVRLKPLLNPCSMRSHQLMHPATTVTRCVSESC